MDTLELRDDELSIEVEPVEENHGSVVHVAHLGCQDPHDPSVAYVLLVCGELADPYDEVQDDPRPWCSKCMEPPITCPVCGAVFDDARGWVWP
jgi:hypothetical protein